MTIRLLHLTDTHLMDRGGRHYGIVDTARHLERVVERAAAESPCDAIVVSGDISEDGSEASYRRARDVIEPLAKHWNAPVAWACGNHDQRETLRRVMRLPGSSTEPINWVVETTSATLVIADTSVPRAGWGFLGETIDWIERQLVPDQTPVLVMHHPPLTPPMRLHGALRLVDAPQLAERLARADAQPRLVLCGHYHLPARGEIAGIPVIVGASTANRTTLRYGTDHESAIVAGGYTVCTVGASVTASTRWVVTGAEHEVFCYGSDAVRAIIRAAGRPDYREGARRHWHGVSGELIAETQYDENHLDKGMDGW